MADFSMLSFSKKTWSSFMFIFASAKKRGTVGFLATGLSAADVLPLGRDASIVSVT